MTKAELDRIVTEVNEIAESSQSIRRRTVEDRAELAGLLREMGKRLAEADAASTNLGQNITMVAESLVREPLPDELRSVRHALIARVERLNQDAGALRTQLARARDRSRHLEDMVQQQAEELIDMRTKAALDPLTNICNRGVFDKAIIALTKRAAGTNSPLSLVVLDVDHFKRVNDTWGHPAGDAVLIGVARCMEEQVREGDVVARIGGEEFALVLPGANLNVARAVAERLRLSVAAANFSEPAAGVKVTASFGVAQMGPSELPKSLIRRADQAMYAAKHAGRNQVKLSEQRG
jgi:diguanylate cyclase (GGDEF)-like protein